jgi:hypothetical protein
MQTAGFFPAPDGQGCILCDPQPGSDATFSSGYSLAATWEAAALADGKCACAAGAPAGRVVAVMSSGGRRYSRCIVCPAGAAADAPAGACVPATGGAPRTAAGDLAYVVAALNARGADINLLTATQVRGLRVNREAS